MDDLIGLDQQEAVADLDGQLLPVLLALRQQLHEPVQLRRPCGRAIRLALDAACAGPARRPSSAEPASTGFSR